MMLQYVIERYTKEVKWDCSAHSSDCYIRIWTEHVDTHFYFPNHEVRNQALIDLRPILDEWKELEHSQ